ncbi:hypothetical protein Pan258_45840 [Symmachiella dynata]|uniref:hypothetical protein n=1 Tax=Symmachiella dynata TaxID=2527995 RepID=UPI00118D3C39|nr:hypothetical protein [Symmachiella dynata]QDT50505.1 hypothetical protein Pan258_45840 [Symmachiella dynata]
MAQHSLKLLIGALIGIQSSVAEEPQIWTSSPARRHHVNNMIHWDILGQGVVQYPDEIVDGPPPRISLSMLRDMIRDSHQPSQFGYVCFTFAQSNDKLPRNVIPMERSDLLKIVRRGDIVLLSFGLGMYGHFTTVYDIDHSKNEVFLLDPWPKMIRNELKAADTTCQIVPLGDSRTKSLLRVNANDFKRLLVGTITLDSPSFVDEVIRVLPHAARKDSVKLAFAHALLDSGDRFLVQALHQFEQLHSQATSEAQRKTAARMTALSQRLLHYRLLREGRLEQASQSRNRDVALHLGELNIDYGLRLGKEAGEMRDFELALSCFSHVLKKEPSHDRAYYYRALARVKALRVPAEKDLTEASKDLSKAITLSLEREAALRSKIQRAMLRSYGQRILDKHRLRQIRRLRADALSVRSRVDLQLAHETHKQNATTEKPLVAPAFTSNKNVVDVLWTQDKLSSSELVLEKIRMLGASKIDVRKNKDGSVVYLEVSGKNVDNSIIPLLSFLPQLETVFLTGTKVNDDGLASFFALPKVRVLEMNGTLVTGKGIEDLIGHLRDPTFLPKLEMIHVSESVLSRAERNRLMELAQTKIKRKLFILY